MKRLIVGLAVVVLVGVGQVEAAVEWTITQLTDNDYSDGNPQVSDKGVGP